MFLFWKRRSSCRYLYFVNSVVHSLDEDLGILLAFSVTYARTHKI